MCEEYENFVNRDGPKKRPTKKSLKVTCQLGWTYTSASISVSLTRPHLHEKKIKVSENGKVKCARFFVFLTTLKVK